MEKIKVLMIDDEEILLRATSIIMANTRYDLSIDSDGMSGLNKIRSGEKFDILLLDLNMPGISGQEILELLNKEGHKIKVLAQTGNSTSNLPMNVEVIKKPYSPEDLIKKLDKMISS